MTPMKRKKRMTPTMREPRFAGFKNPSAAKKTVAIAIPRTCTITMGSLSTGQHRTVQDRRGQRRGEERRGDKRT